MDGKGLDIVNDALEAKRIDSYNLTETDTELYITERVNNIIFVKE